MTCIAYVMFSYVFWRVLYPKVMLPDMDFWSVKWNETLKYTLQTNNTESNTLVITQPQHLRHNTNLKIHQWDKKIVLSQGF
jgi:hypothetical protein